jgi:transcriptional regulator GlxA family with amidase domain
MGKEAGMYEVGEATVAKGRSLRRSATIRKAIAYIEQNSSERVTLQALAEVTNLSLFRFATVFRCETGLSPHRYLCRVRVEHAKTLLESGVPLAIVASEAGFFDQSHLSRHFKSLCGVTPGKYLSQVRSFEREPRRPPSAVAGAAACVPQHAAA